MTKEFLKSLLELADELVGIYKKDVFKLGKHKGYVSGYIDALVDLGVLEQRGVGKHFYVLTEKGRRMLEERSRR